MDRQEKFEAKARAYALAVQAIEKLLDDDLSDESVETLKELNVIVRNLEKKRVRKLDYAQKKPSIPHRNKRKVTVVKPDEIFDLDSKKRRGKGS